MKKCVSHLFFVLISVSVSLVSNAQKDTMLASATMKKVPLRLNSLKMSSSKYQQGKLLFKGKDLAAMNFSNRACCDAAGKNTAWCNRNLLKYQSRLSFVVPEHRCLP